MAATEIATDKLVEPAMIEAIIRGPNKANRLFIFTGIAIVDLSGDDDNVLGRTSRFINLSKAHSRPFAPVETAIAPVAYLASLHGNEDAEQFLWAVDRVTAMVDGQELKLFTDLAIQGKDTIFLRLAYQVNVTTSAVTVKDLILDASPTTAGQAVALIVELSEPALQGGQEVLLTTDKPGDLNNSLPPSVVVPEGNTKNPPITLQTRSFTTPATISVKIRAAIGAEGVEKTLVIRAPQ